MKIFEIVEEQFKEELPKSFPKSELKKRFPNSGSLSLSSTDASELKYKGVQVSNVILPQWEPKVKDALAANKGMYMLYNKENYILIDRDDPQGLRVATAIVKALLKEPIKPGMWGRIRDKWDDLTDPDDPESSAYDVLNKKKWGLKPNRGPKTTIATKIGAKIDKALGLGN